MAYIKIDSEGRITAASKSFHCGEGEIEVTIPEEIGLESIHEYRYENSEFIYDPKQQEATEQEVSTQELLLEVAADHEYRLCLMELGVSEDDL